MLLAMFYWIAFIIKPKRRLFRPVLIVLPSYTARWQCCHRAVYDGRMGICERQDACLQTAKSLFANSYTFLQRWYFHRRKVCIAFYHPFSDESHACSASSLACLAEARRFAPTAYWARALADSNNLKWKFCFSCLKRSSIFMPRCAMDFGKHEIS